MKVSASLVAVPVAPVVTAAIAPYGRVVVTTICALLALLLMLAGQELGRRSLERREKAVLNIVPGASEAKLKAAAQMLVAMGSVTPTDRASSRGTRRPSADVLRGR